MKHKIAKIFILLFAFQNFSCEKPSTTEIPQIDYREQYTGSWNFKVHSYKMDMRFGLIYSDTFNYNGVINLGSNENDIIIQYKNDAFTIQILEYDGKILNKCWGVNHYCGGSFDEEKIFYLKLQSGNLSGSITDEISGVKISDSSPLNKPPIAYTEQTIGITVNGANLQGTVNANFLFTKITFEYGTSTNYGFTTIANESPIAGHSFTKVSANISNLTQGSIYHVRIKAENLLGTSYGNDLTFSTLSETAQVIDIDGNKYKTVPIGNQIWFAENLKSTHYSNGDSIETTTPATFDISNEIMPKYQWIYNNSESNLNQYGRLYTWYAARDSRNICPTGWHVPSSDDWNKLINSAGTDAGRLLKESGTNHWISPNDANNLTGFTALSGGIRAPYGQYNSIGETSFWWSSSELIMPYGNSGNIFYIDHAFNTVFNMPSGSKGIGLSIRCLKN